MEYRRYLQVCVDTLIQMRRLNVPRGEKLRFFPVEKVLQTNQVGQCQEHAIGIVKGWAQGRYTTHVKNLITKLKKSSEVDEVTAFKLYTIGKYTMDRPSAEFPRETLDQYWELLLSVGKTPQIGPSVHMQCGVNTADFRRLEGTPLTEWWVSFSTLTKYQTVRLPLKSNPFVKNSKDLVKGVQFKKDKRGRWRMDAVERRDAEAPARFDAEKPRVGVDVGLNVLAATSDGRVYGRDVKATFDKHWYKIKTLRANRQRQGLKENSPRLDLLESRLSGFIKTLTGNVANKLVKSYENHVFVVEDLNLSGCRGQKRFAYRALHASLARKAPTLVVNPAYTSQECPSCTYVSKSNRKGTEFNCRGCGRQGHADVVGAINLLRRSQDNQIGLDDDPSEVEKLLLRRLSEKRARHVDFSRSKPRCELTSGELTVDGTRKGHA